MTEAFDAAAAYAIDLHRHDLRKATSIPYVSHLFAVCALVLENGGNETEAMGALLHDAAEDHGGREQLETIRQRFGDAVAEIVDGCSDSLEPEGAEKPPWLERKKTYIERLEREGAEHESTMLVSAADKVHNLRTIREGVARARGDDRFYERFKGGKWGTLWYYRALSEAFARHRGRHRHLALELAEMAGQLSDGIETAELLARFEART